MYNQAAFYEGINIENPVTIKETIKEIDENLNKMKNMHLNEIKRLERH